MWFFFRRWRERQQAQVKAQTESDVELERQVHNVPTQLTQPIQPTQPTQPIQPTQPRARPLSFEQITQGFGDFNDFRTHNAALKFWLPEPANQALVEFCHAADQSLSEWMRQFFVVYAYGLLAFNVINESCPGFFRDHRLIIRCSVDTIETDPPGKKRVTTYWVPELGKNVVPVKVWIPARMKDDLQILADHAELPLSQFTREIVISRLLGHGTLPARPILTCAEPTVAEDWCEDQAVPWREVSEDEYAHHRHRQGEVRWHYEDAMDDDEGAPILALPSDQALAPKKVG